MSVSDVDPRGQEIAALLARIREDVRARYPGASVAVKSPAGASFAVPLPDLLPLLHARDAAQGKVASIGTVNPRRAGVANQIIQVFKRSIARALGWFIRDQITFNREILACVEAAQQALAEVNQSLATIAGQLNSRIEAFSALSDMYAHWDKWRVEWEQKLSANELQFLRSAADLQTGFSHRATLMENNFRDIVKAQHGDYLGALDRTTVDIQKRLWVDLEKIRHQYERLIQSELRIIRQRLQPRELERMNGAASQPTSETTRALDYQWFAERFRGSEPTIRESQRYYIPLFQNIGRVLDLGCGRGEFLELLREAGIEARGIDDDAESVAYCQSKDLNAERADLFSYLGALPEKSEDAIFCSQVVEHLDPLRLPDLIRLCSSRLRTGGLLVIETPNPSCLAIFATYFYLDPTHTRPVPSDLLAHYMHEFGFGETELRTFSPAVENFPELKSLPPEFTARFFGGLDYGIIARKIQ